MNFAFDYLQENIFDLFYFRLEHAFVDLCDKLYELQA